MGINFPSSPVVGDLWPLPIVPGIPQYRWDGTSWLVIIQETKAYIQWTTGDIKPTYKIVADVGWIIMNDGTIGNAASGSTTRAHADTVDLFTLFYTVAGFLILQDSSGSTVSRGASAAADFAANRRLALPKTLGRALMGYGTGAGLTLRALGGAYGSETETQTIAKIATHSHDMGIATDTAGTAQYYKVVMWGPVPPMSVANSGSGSPLSILPPVTAINIMVKL